MDNMIEHVAKALGTAAAEWANSPPYDKTPESCWKHLAQSAVEAMREPTKAMIEAGRGLQSIGDETLDADDMQSKWQSMIDAALRGL